MSGSPLLVFHLHEYSIGEPSIPVRDFHFTEPSDAGAEPNLGTFKAS